MQTKPAFTRPGKWDLPSSKLVYWNSSRSRKACIAAVVSPQQTGEPRISPSQRSIFLNTGRRWKIPILWNLAEYGSLYYNELRRPIAPVTNTVLTRCLREPEGDGLIRRLNHPIPPSVEYRLSERGQSLLPSLRALYEWGRAQQA